MLDVQRFWEIVLFSWITGNSDMHCKNFSLIDNGGGEYTVSPAYDLLSVTLADPNDPEEMAMPFEVGGRKTGFDKLSFLNALTGSGIPDAVAVKIIYKMTKNLPAWTVLIDSSFLPEDLKSSYKNILTDRISRLK